MTKDQCITKIQEMVYGKDFVNHVCEEINRLLNSGALDLESEPEESYAMPKVVLTVVLENVCNDYAPLSGEYKKTLHNLRRI